MHTRRRRRAARRRVEPFNLKAAGRGPALALSSPRQTSPVGWAGPWVDLGRPCATEPLGRLAVHALNTWRLWVASPAQGGWGAGATSWLRQALRGLTGRVSLKLRFKGKSFRWHRRGGALVLRFGHSHLVVCPPPSHTRWTKHGKAKMVFFHTNLAVLRNFLLAVVAWREPNRYHSRGLRLARQRIVRKAGKVSAYR